MKIQLPVSLRQRAVFSRHNRGFKKRIAVTNAGNAAVEILESRQMLSVSASSMLGPVNTETGTYSNELVSSGTVIETASYTIIGKTTFAGQTCVETDSVSNQSGGLVSTSEKNYAYLTSSGYVSYGGTSVVNEDGSIVDGNTSYASPEVVLPASMTAGTNYTESDTATDQESTTAGVSTGTVVTMTTTVLNLESAQKTITVPAGTFNSCYVVDETINSTTTTSTAGGSPTTTTAPAFTAKEYFAPNKGLVEFSVGSTVTELTSYNTSGGGGGGSVTGLTPAITKDTVPPAIVTGAKIRGDLIVDFTNPGSATETGFTTNVYASLTQTLDTTTDPLVTSLVKTTSIKAGKSELISIPITSLPTTVPPGMYYLIAQTVDSAGNTQVTASAGTVTTAAPFVALSEVVTDTLPPSLVSGTTVKGSVTLAITNSGNVTSKGVTPTEITISPAAGMLGTTIATASKNLSIAPGKTVKETVRLTGIPALADDAYYIVTQVTDPFAGGVSIASSKSIIIAAPYVFLSATLGPVGKITSGDTLTITNTGNIANVTTFNATLGFSTDPQGADSFGNAVSITIPKMTIKPQKSVKVHLTKWTLVTSSLVPGAYYLTIVIADETGDIASAVSTTSFVVT